MVEKIKNLSTSLQNFLGNQGEQYAKAGLKIVTVVLSLFIIFSFIVRKSFGTLACVLLILSFLWYLLLQGSLSDDAKPSVKRWFMADLYLTVACIALVPYCWISDLFGGLSSSLMLIGMMFVACAEVLVVAFRFSKSGKAFWEWLDTGIQIGGAGSQQELKPGDVVLCDNKELVEAKAKDPREIIPCHDRFLHMLILGPTGGGKTSQVILPLCNQDIHNLEAGVTVLEPKGDLAREVAMMAEEMGRPYIYFDPSVDNCPFFNPLIGDETDVIENAVTTFLSLNPDSPQYFKDLSEQLVRNTLKVLKRLDKDKGIDGYYSTFIWMSRVLQNNGGQGRELVQKFSRIRSATPDEAKENADIASWFLNEYFAERSKIYENSSGIRSQVAKVIANRYLRHVLNPDVEKGEYNEIDFDKHLADSGVICISTAQGLMRDLGKFLGYFLILQFKSAVFRRPGDEFTRRPHFLYIDEFQQYSTPGFSEMLTQGRSYRVACHLATQARAQMEMGAGRDGRSFVNLVSTNARNIVVFPGGSKDDAEFYSKQFGEYEKEEVAISHTRKSFNLLTGGLSPLGHPSESDRISYKMTPIFSASELIYRPFGEIVYCIIKNNTIQKPKVGLIKWLDKEYDNKLKQMIKDKIVTHEIVHSDWKTTPEPHKPDNDEPFTWEDEVSPEEEIDFESVQQSSTPEKPEKEPVSQEQPSAAEVAAMFDEPKKEPFDDSWLQEEPMVDDFDERENTLDDGHGDPFIIDGDDLI